jgi:hypothetical protein
LRSNSYYSITYKITKKRKRIELNGDQRAFAIIGSCPIVNSIAIVRIIDLNEHIVDADLLEQILGRLHYVIVIGILSYFHSQSAFVPIRAQCPEMWILNTHDAIDLTQLLKRQRERETEIDYNHKKTALFCLF